METDRAGNGIEVHGLVREFRKGPRAVDGIDLAVAPGEIYGFLGPNGAGKSTTVHMLTTLLPPTAGTATVAGHDIVREGPEVRDVGVVLLETLALPGRRLVGDLDALQDERRRGGAEPTGGVHGGMHVHHLAAVDVA